MTTKKIFGYLFIIIAVILTLTLITLLPRFMKVLLAMFKPNSNSYDIGYSVGYIAFLIIHTIVTIIFWRLGIRWTKKV